jgi:hypothetical protein
MNPIPLCSRLLCLLATIITTCTAFAASPTSLDDKRLLEVPSFPLFLQGWLGPKSEPRRGLASSAMSYTVRVEADRKNLFKALGDPEFDEILNTFRIWCEKHYGPAGEVAANSPLININREAREPTPEKGTTLACLSAGKIAGALRVEKYKVQKDVELAIFAFTQESIAQSPTGAQRAAIERYEESRAKLQRELQRRAQEDAAYRSQLSVGSTVCWAGTASGTRINGMVIEIKSPIAFVQFPQLTPNQTIWVKLSDLGAPC